MKSGMDDSALIERAKSDKDAFGHLYERYVDKIYNYVYYRTGNVADAEDLTARIFFRAMGHIGNYDDRGIPFSAWLYRIVHNLVANWHRDNSRRQEVPLDDGQRSKARQDHPERALLYNEEQRALLSLIKDLPEDRQQLLILKFVDHLSNAEIGKIMGRTEGAIKSLYHRTLSSLRENADGEPKAAGRENGQ